MNRYIDFLHRRGAPMQLVALNTAIYLLVTLLALLGIDSSDWVSLPSSLSELAMRPWTPLTYMVVHYSFFHLLFNMLWLYWFGEFFLTLGTNRQLIALYIYGGLLGAAFYLAAYNLPWHLPGSGLLSGASASVLAIVVAAAWLMPRFKMQLFILGEVSLKWIAAATVILSVLALPGDNAGGNMAHLGGALTGAVFAFAFRRGLDITRIGGRKKRSRFITVKPSSADTDKAMLDELLDKVRQSGYKSLNASERKKLLELSNKL